MAPASPAELTPTPAEIITAVAEVTPAPPTRAAAAPTDPWGKLLADPGRAPEHLALAAVRTLGPRARDWATHARAAYPHATNRALARLAAGQFTRLGSLGSALGALAGSYAPATLLATAAITQAELTLHIAAAYGLDPTDPDRAAELLVIARVHPTVDEARAAMTADTTTTLWRIAGRGVTQTAGWTFIKRANRRFPGTAFLAALLAGANAANGAAARADAYYRRRKDSQD